MSDGKASLAKRYPLHLTIAFAFTALLLVIGLLQLVNARDQDGTVTSFSSESLRHIEALFSDAAVALDSLI